MNLARTIFLGLCVAIIACNTQTPPPPPDSTSVVVQRDQLPTPAWKRPKPPVAHDTRPQDDIDQAACTGADGAWSCPKLARKPKMKGVFAPTSLLPASWTVPAWFIDPANTSGNASDFNTCTTALAPCVTFGQLLIRWGSRSVIFNQATTITYLSDAPSTDPIQFTAITGQAGIFGSLTFQGALIPVAGPLTLASATARNTGTGTLTHINVTAHTWTRGQFVVDDTTASAMWVTSDAGGGTANTTTPMLRDGSFGNGSVAAGNTIHVFRPSTLYIDNLQVVGEDLSVTVQNVTINGGESLIGNNALLNECGTSSSTAIETAPSYPVISIIEVNSMIDSVFRGPIIALGGDLGQNNTVISTNSALDNDVVVEGANDELQGAVLFGSVYTAAWFGGAGIRSSYRISTASVNFNTPVIWGPATINPTTGSQISLLGLTAAATLVCTGGIHIDGATTAFPWNAATHAYLAAVATSAANIDSNTNLANPATGTRISVQ